MHGPPPPFGDPDVGLLLLLTPVATTGSAIAAFYALFTGLAWPLWICLGLLAVTVAGLLAKGLMSGRRPLATGRLVLVRSAVGEAPAYRAGSPWTHAVDLQDADGSWRRVVFEQRLAEQLEQGGLGVAWDDGEILLGYAALPD